MTKIKNVEEEEGEEEEEKEEEENLDSKKNPKVPLKDSLLSFLYPNVFRNKKNISQEAKPIKNK